MELMKYKKGSEGAEDGLHIPGLSEHDSETLCGLSITGDIYHTVYKERPTCPHCIAILKELFLERGYTKKVIKNW